MTTREGTSAVEGVGSREQRNAQTQGELHTSSKGTTKGQRSKKNHTVTNQSKYISARDKRSKQQPKPRIYRDDNISNRQKRAGQWRLQAIYNTKSFKKSCGIDRLMTEPSYEDLMNEVDRKNRFAVAPDGQKEADKKLMELKAFKRKQAVQDMADSRQWKRGGHGFIEDKATYWQELNQEQTGP